MHTPTNWNALYFSRSIIPYQRNAEKQDWLKGHTYYKHIGLYAYRTDVLKEITMLPQSSLELAESLEQLRWLENGYKIKVGISEVETIGIDTPQDLERAPAKSTSMRTTSCSPALITVNGIPFGNVIRTGGSIRKFFRVCISGCILRSIRLDSILQKFFCPLAAVAETASLVYKPDVARRYDKIYGCYHCRETGLLRFVARTVQLVGVCIHHCLFVE